jgi:hypothetical protein
MNSTGPRTIAERLQLAPPEEQLLKRIVTPDPPGRVKSFFQRPLRDPGEIVGAVTLTILGVALLWLVVTLVASSLGDSGSRFLRFLDDSPLLHFLIPVGVFVVLLIRDARTALMERLIRRLYSAVEQGKQDNLGEHRGTEER